MRNLFSTIVLLSLLLSLSAWAVDDDNPFDLGEPGSSTTGYRIGGSYLGIDTQDITAARASALKLKEERGAEVVMVDQDAPAGKAGIKEHDVILEFNGARVESVEQLRRLIHETPPGRTVNVGVSRDGQLVNIPVQLADRAKALVGHLPEINVMPHVDVNPHISVMPEIDMPAFDIVVRTTRSGLTVESLTPQLGEFFGAKGGDGVLIRSVEKGSQAESAGFKAGDVIVRVDNDKIANSGDWRMALRAHSGSKVTVGVIRDKHEQNVTFTVPGKTKDQSQMWLPGEGMEWEDFSIDVDRTQLRHIHDAFSSAATQWRDELRKNSENYQTTMKEWQRQLKAQQEQWQRSLRELQRSWHITQREL